MENLQKCSCGRLVTRAWRVYRLEPDSRPFGSGIDDMVPCGHMGDCGQLHAHFEVYPHIGIHQCQPVEVSREHRLNQEDLPPGVVLLPNSYRYDEKPSIEHPILDAISKLKIKVEDGQLVVNLPSNGQVPSVTPINLTPAGCRIQILDLKQFASV